MFKNNIWFKETALLIMYGTKKQVRSSGGTWNETGRTLAELLCQNITLVRYLRNGEYIQQYKWEKNGGRVPKDLAAYSLYHTYSFGLSVGISYLNWPRNRIANFICLAMATNGTFIVIWGQYKWEKKEIGVVLEQSLVGHHTLFLCVLTYFSLYSTTSLLWLWFQRNIKAYILSLALSKTSKVQELKLGFSVTFWEF